MTRPQRFGDRLGPWMIDARYRSGRWADFDVVPTEASEWAPQARGLHYGQAVFEGLKAHRGPDGEVRIFRLEDHLARLQRSARRLVMPKFDEKALDVAIRELVALQATSCPDAPGSLYLRPLLIADESGLLAEPADAYRMMVLVSPVDAYLRRDRLVRLRTESEFVRAFPGGTGDVKYSGNYAAVFQAKMRARADGFDELLWLDALEKRYVEETSSMNLMIVKDGVLTTPPAGGTILPGITRDSLLRLAEEQGISCREERTAIDADWSQVSEVFSSGTAVGVLPIGEIVHREETLFSRSKIGPVCEALGAAYARVVSAEGSLGATWTRPVKSDDRGTSRV